MSNMEQKIKKNTYIIQTPDSVEICGYIAYSLPDKNKNEFDFPKHDIVDIRHLELKYLNSLEEHKPLNQREKYDLNKLYYQENSISYFFIWGDGVAQIGFSTDTMEKARDRMSELQKILEYGGFYIDPDPVRFTNEIPW